jgi:hypothetical protein
MQPSLVHSCCFDTEKLPVLRSVVIDPPVRLRFTDPEPLAPPLVQLDDVDFKYTVCGVIVRSFALLLLCLMFGQDAKYPTWCKQSQSGKG